MNKKILLLSLAIFLVPLFAGAEDLATLCQQISSTANSCQNLSSADCQATLQKCADYYDQQSAQISKDLTKTTAQKKTLQNAVGALKKKITGLEAQISQGTLMVKDLNIQIGDTQNSINKTENQIQQSQNEIKGILQSMYEEDQKPSFVILLEGNLSDFFSNVTYLESLNSRISGLLESTTNLKSYLEAQRGKQETEKGQLQKTIQTQTLAKQQNEQNRKQQDTLLKLTEAQYQQQQKDKSEADKKAASIKTRIFDLLGVSNAPNFAEAVTIAKWASGITGVRAALILAILTQESNLGKNVGQCYLKDTTTGAGVKIKTGVASPKTMNPKSISTFLNLIDQINKGKNLSRDPLKTPVSCVIYYNGAPYGWGGAMGPSQFIASTWVGGGYGDKVAAVTGKVADPWDIRDAFLATGFLLKDNGAKTSEYGAAMKYYCGGSCTKYDKFYGNSVVSIANGYEDDIAAIGG